MSANKPLDRIDFELIRLLQNNARMSNKDLARRVGLAPSSCHARVAALTAAGVLKGFHADVDTEALGIGQQALYFISLTQHSRAVVEEFFQTLLALPEVVNVYLISGKTDFVVHAVASDTRKLRDFALDHITIRPEVTQIETALIFDQQRCFEWPQFAAGRSTDEVAPSG